MTVEWKAQGQELPSEPEDRKFQVGLVRLPDRYDQAENSVEGLCDSCEN